MVARTRTLSRPHGSTTTVSPAPVQISWCPLLRTEWSAGAITGSPSIRERGASGGRQEDAHRRGPAFGPPVVRHEADLRGGLPARSGTSPPWLPDASLSVPNGRAPGRSSGSATTRTSTRRSEEHTSELQSRGHLVCRLLLEKKKNHA